MRRKASEISKAELVEMIANLRGMLYESREEVLDQEEIDELLGETTFDDDLNETYSRVGKALEKENKLDQQLSRVKYVEPVVMEPPELTSIETKHVPGKGILKLVPFNDYLILKSRELKDKVLMIDGEEWLVRGIEYFSKAKWAKIGLIVRKWKCEHGYEWDSCPWPIANDPDACEYAHGEVFLDVEQKPMLVEDPHQVGVKIYPKVRMRRELNQNGGRYDKWIWAYHCTLGPIIDDQGNVVEWEEVKP